MPAPDLARLVDPAHCALVTQEVQGAIVGPHAALQQLADAARLETLPNIARLLPVARSAGVQVVHCLAHRRPDGKGSNTNGRLFQAAEKFPVDMSPGSEGGSLLPEMGPEPDDIVLTRTHGVGPMAGTDLDSVLRNLGITTIVGVGVSVNVAIPNLVMDAVNRGYWFVLPRDAVAGVPPEYADAVIDNTLALLATVVATDDLIALWT
jgi:nicotinamidase-related amidase